MRKVRPKFNLSGGHTSDMDTLISTPVKYYMKTLITFLISVSDNSFYNAVR